MKDQHSSQGIQQQPSQQGADVPFSVDHPSSTQTECVGGKDNEPNVNDFESLRERIRVDEKWMVYLTAALVIVSIGGVITSLLQWNTMRDQLNEMRRQFTQDQRPYVMPTHVEVEQFTPGRQIIIKLRWVNYGKSQAIRTSGPFAILYGANALEQADRWFEIEAPKPRVSAPERVVPPGIPSNPLEAEFSTLVSPNAISQDEFDLLRRTNFSIAVVIRQVYFDVAGNRYWTDSCFSNLAGSIAMPDCPKHNEPN